MNPETIQCCREALMEVKGLARTLDQVKHYRGATYYQDKIARIDAALTALEQAAPQMEVCDIDTKSDLISRAQFRGITEQGYVLMRPATAASESQESVFSRAASGIALAALRQAHERGETISIPSLGIEIPPSATAAGEELT